MAQSLRLDKRIELWGPVEFENERKETDYKDTLIKTIWAQIIPQTGKMRTHQADSILADVTHKIKVRYGSGKDIKEDMWFMYQGHRFDINYILEIFCQEIIGG